MKKLLEQIIKFGIVGVLCFAIDFIITLGVSALMRNIFTFDMTKAALIGAFWGFVISVIINYLLSMKFVFVRKEGMDKRKEFIIFVILSLIGLGINELIIKLSIDLWKLMSTNYTQLAEVLNAGMITAGAKIVATAIVMVYNFITRKIFLEQKEG